jgi:D-serine deaminase-like pyridoxal phosphate-dependent protein
MGYEAQIAGLADTNPFAPLLNPAKKLIKRLSVRDVAQKRENVAALLKSKGIAITFFNGGGTGSLSSTLREDAITEATAGSGFLQSHLFDYYATNQNEAAEFVALRVSRAPDAHVVTCHGGGIIGSGEIGSDKAMIPVLPLGISLLPTEGCGEVQTPLRKKSSTILKPGQPVLFRPAKTGEPLERFREVHLFSDQKWLKSVPTYRGMNEEFQ